MHLPYSFVKISEIFDVKQDSVYSTRKKLKKAIKLMCILLCIVKLNRAFQLLIQAQAKLAFEAVQSKSTPSMLVLTVNYTAPASIECDSVIAFSA